MLYIRELWYRDNNGRQRPVRIESTDPAELERVAGLYAAMERRTKEGGKAWRRRHATFTDLDVQPGRVAEAVGSPEGNAGLPWEGPRFAFALLLGEGFPWAGPESLWVEAGEGKGRRCRCCGHYAALPLIACCLNGGCSRTGRDLAIPRPTVSDLKRREERKPEPTKLPAPLKDRTGKVLRGGTGGKR